MHHERRPAHPDLLLRCVLAITIISIPAALTLRSSFPSVGADFRYSWARPFIEAGVFLLSIILYRAVVATSSEPHSYARAVRFLILLGSLVGGYAIYQQMAYHAGLPLVSLPSPIGLSRALVTALPNGGSTFRSNATFVEPLDLGRCLVGTSMVMLSCLLGRIRLGIDRRWLLVGLSVQLAALVVTFSSSAYAGLAASAISAVVFSRRRLNLALGVVLIASLIGLSAAIVSMGPLEGDVSPGAVITSRGERALRARNFWGRNLSRHPEGRLLARSSRDGEEVPADRRWYRQLWPGRRGDQP